MYIYVCMHICICICVYTCIERQREMCVCMVKPRRWSLRRWSLRRCFKWVSHGHPPSGPWLTHWEHFDLCMYGQASQTLFEVLSLSPLHNVRESMYLHVYTCECICMYTGIQRERKREICIDMVKLCRCSFKHFFLDLYIMQVKVYLYIRSCTGSMCVGVGVGVGVCVCVYMTCTGMTLMCTFAYVNTWVTCLI